MEKSRTLSDNYRDADLVDISKFVTRECYSRIQDFVKEKREIGEAFDIVDLFEKVKIRGDKFGLLVNINKRIEVLTAE